MNERYSQNACIDRQVIEGGVNLDCQTKSIIDTYNYRLYRLIFRSGLPLAEVRRIYRIMQFKESDSSEQINDTLLRFEKQSTV
jgi:hypothetical protein